MLAVLLLLCLAALVTPGGAAWGYGDSDGPATWGSISQTCSTGMAQSPIPLVVADATEDTALGTLTFTGYDAPPMGMEMVNDGHTLAVTVTSQITSTISGGGLNATYKLHSFHFHWGSDGTKGSEHTLDGTRYPAELHVVHYLSSAGSLGDASNTTDGLAVLGFMITGGGSTHAGLDKILSLSANVTYKDENVQLTPFAMDDLLPADRDRFLRYEGSLTTPPCQEVVTWTVFISTIQVADAQLAALRELKDAAFNTTEKSLQDNYRPLQALNGRQVTANFKQTGDTGGAAGTHVSLGLLALLLCLLCIR